MLSLKSYAENMDFEERIIKNITICFYWFLLMWILFLYFKPLPITINNVVNSLALEITLIFYLFKKNEVTI